MEWAVETRSLRKEFAGREAVADLSLQVPVGTFFALLGLEGAGKSTFLKMLIGLQRPSGGEGYCLGMDIQKESLRIRERVGYVSQQSRLYGYMTAEELAAFCRGLYLKWDDDLVKRYLDFFELPRRCKINEFTPEMKSKLSLILALAQKPDLLLLDEPISNFDPFQRRLFYNAVMQEMVSAGKTVLLATHQVDDVERVADLVALLRGGRVVKICSLDELRLREKEIRVVFQKEPPEELFRQPGISRVYREGMAYRIVVSDHLEEIWQLCATQPHFALEVVSTGLEEIFLNYMEGGGRHD